MPLSPALSIQLGAAPRDQHDLFQFRALAAFLASSAAAFHFLLAVPIASGSVGSMNPKLSKAGARSAINLSSRRGSPLSKNVMCSPSASLREGSLSCAPLVVAKENSVRLSS